MKRSSPQLADQSERDTWDGSDVHDSYGYAFLTELGWMLVSWRQTAMTRLVFDQPTGAAAWSRLEGETAGESIGDAEPPGWLRSVIDRLEGYAAGQAADFRDVPLEFGRLTPFQRAVIDACRRIPWGSTRTYGQLAADAGSPRAARAVGSVMANNRFPVIVPCHRVTAAGKLGGFSSTRGVDTKRRMLEMEGAVTPRRTPV